MEVLYSPGIDNCIIDDPTVKIEWGEHAVRTGLGVFCDPIIITKDSMQIVGGIFHRESSDLNSFYFKTPQHEILINNFDNPRQFIDIQFCLYDNTGRYNDPFGAISEADISLFDKSIILLISNQYIYIVRDDRDLNVDKINRVGNSKFSGWPGFEISSDGNSLCVNEGAYERTLFNYRVIDISSKPKVTRACLEKIERRKSYTYHYGGKSHLYCSRDNSKGSIIAYKYATEKLSPIILKNEFDDDSSINIDVVISNSDTEAVGVLGKIAISPIEPYLIYGISPVDILIAYMEMPGYNSLSAKMSEEYIKTCRIIFKKMMKKYGMNEIETAKYLYRNYCQYCFDDSLAVTYGERINSREKQKKYTKLYNEIYEQMITNGEIQPKWKSEADLYTLIKKHFNDAVFQYRDTALLGYQSFDVYVPSKKLAFEYQGMQHYKNIEFFGGEEGFKKRRLLDERKREICKNHGIVLIEWRYDEPISVIELRGKLKEIDDDV